MNWNEELHHEATDALEKCYRALSDVIDIADDAEDALRMRAAEVLRDQINTMRQEIPSA